MSYYNYGGIHQLAFYGQPDTQYYTSHTSSYANFHDMFNFLRSTTKPLLYEPQVKTPKDLMRNVIYEIKSTKTKMKIKRLRGLSSIDICNICYENCEVIQCDYCVFLVCEDCCRSVDTYKCVHCKNIF